MKFILTVLVVFTLFSGSLTAQNNLRKHKVEKGETVAGIAKKYKITPYDIYRLNPDSKNGLKENTVLIIPNEIKPQPQQPVAAKEKTTKITNPVHVVEAKETLYSIAKKYNVTVEALTKANGDAVKNGLQIGQKVIVPVKGDAVDLQVKKIEKEEAKKDAPSYMFHTVVAGDTKYSIAKKYGMTLQLLEELNPEVKDNLPLEYKLKLDKNAIVKKETEPVAPATPDVTDVAVIKPAQKDYMVYKVMPKETLYNLTKKTGLTEEEIIALNPEVKDGLREGMELKLPKAVPGTDAAINTGTVAAPSAIADLSKSLKKSETKEIAMLLPFNLERMDTDEARALMLKNDKFLNMTLDFYAGALMAIDSAKALGIPVKVRIYDAKESKNTSDVESLKGELSKASAVIGPFFQGNVERTAAMLGNNIPVISPLSKEPGKPYANLYQSMPSPDRVKMAMANYLKSKDGNVIAIVDPKKASSRVFIKENYPTARFIEGAVTNASLLPLLSKDKMNYVVLESENKNMIINTTKILNEALAQYQIQLAVLEKNDAMDHDEIPLQNLTGLNLLYPSVTKDNETAEGSVFAKVFKKKNNIFPNQFATRGFDVTFDVIVRLFQQEGFNDIMKTKATEQVENKFMYQNENGGNYNTGVYIMYYDKDLNVKEAQ